MSRSHRISLIALLVAICGSTLAYGFAERHIIEDSLTALRHTEWPWIPLAILCEASSMTAAARKQRRLLDAGDVKTRLLPMTALTYAGNAISFSVPVVGSQMGTVYTFRKLEEGGVETQTAGWSLTVGGVASTISLLMIVSAAALFSRNSFGVVMGAIGAVALCIPIVIVLIGIRHDRFREVAAKVLEPLVRFAFRVVRRPKHYSEASIDDWLSELAELQLSSRHSLWVFASATWNWLADILCFVVCIHAIGAAVPWRAIILVYAAGIGSGSLNLTPGGLGVVEVALAAALTRAGVHNSEALSATLLYRIVSFWLMVLVGWIVFLILRRARRVNLIERDTASDSGYEGR